MRARLIWLQAQLKESEAQEDRTKQLERGPVEKLKAPDKVQAEEIGVQTKFNIVEEPKKEPDAANTLLKSRGYPQR